MKSLYTFLFLFLFSSGVVIAQEAPDFTITDVHGVEHSLYADYLDQGKTVVLDLFFVDCPPCVALMPFLVADYEKWGAGNHDVEFISLTGDPNGVDNDAYVTAFEETHGVTWPTASNEGGGPEAQQPYTAGTWGQFFGYPTLIVIAPDRSVQFDAWGGAPDQSTIDILDQWIANTGAEIPVSSNADLSIDSGMTLFPNPAQVQTSLSFELSEASQVRVRLFDILGHEVFSLAQGFMSEGTHSIAMELGGLAAGQYLVQINTETAQQAMRLQVVD